MKKKRIRVVSRHRNTGSLSIHSFFGAEEQPAGGVGLSPGLGADSRGRDPGPSPDSEPDFAGWN